MITHHVIRQTVHHIYVEATDGTRTAWGFGPTEREAVADATKQLEQVQRFKAAVADVRKAEPGLMRLAEAIMEGRR